MKTRTTYSEWSDVEQENDVAKAMKRVQRWTEHVGQGTRPVAYLCGGAGVGKTRAIKNGLRNSPHQPLFLSPTRYTDLIEAFREAGGKRPIIFEEADQVLNSVRMVNLLKIATDEDGPRLAEAGKFGRVKMNAPILLASNRNMNDDAAFPKEVREHIAALRSRSAPLVIPNAPLQVWEYACHLAITQNLIRTDQKGRGISIATQNAALEWFTRHIWRMDDVSPRRLKQIALTFARYGADEEDFALSDLQANLIRSAEEVSHLPVLPIPEVIPFSARTMPVSVAA